MKRLCAFAALVLLSTSAHAGTIFSFEVQGRVVHINAPSGCASLACISVSSPEFHGSNYRRGSRTKLASKTVSARKARAPAGNSLSLAKAPNAEDAIAASRTVLSTANSKRAVVATEPTKAPSIDMPAAPATVVGTLPSADSDAASGPTSLTKPMPVDATSDGSAFAGKRHGDFFAFTHTIDRRAGYSNNRQRLQTCSERVIVGGASHQVLWQSERKPGGNVCRRYCCFPHAAIDGQFETGCCCNGADESAIGRCACNTCSRGRDATFPHRLACGVRSNFAHKTDAGRCNVRWGRFAGQCRGDFFAFTLTINRRAGYSNDRQRL